MIYIVTIGLLLISVRLYIKYLTFFQQEHYNLKKFLHHTKNFYQNDYHVLVIYLLFIIYCLDIHLIINIIIGILLILISFAFKQMVIRLKVTKRIIRLLITTFLLIVVYIYFLIKITDISYTCFIITFLIPVTIIITNNINYPIEKIISFYYICKAKSKLAQHKDLLKIGITGSFGKTTTKNILTNILSTEYSVVMSPASYNTPLGISKTINNLLHPTTEVLVAEMGAYRIGEIRYLAEMVKPQIGIVTSVGPQHLSTFKTVDNVLKTKVELLEALPNDGIGIINIDNEYLKNYESNLKCKLVTVGIKENADYQAQRITYQNNQMRFSIYYQGEYLFEVSTNLLGYHNIYNILASIACACEIKKLGFNVSIPNIIEGIQKAQPVLHRLSVSKKDNITILDDSFNSNIEGFLSAIEVTKTYKIKKVIITPGIVDGGKKQEELNRRVGIAMGKVFDEVCLINNPASKAIEKVLQEVEYRDIHIYSRFIDAYNEVLRKYQNEEIVLLIENDLPDNFLERSS